MPHRLLLMLLLLALALATPATAAGSDSQVRALVKQLRATEDRAHQRTILSSIAEEARGGSALAAEVMARVFGKGLFGISRDPSRARRYLELAARLGSGAARRYLAKRSPAPPPGVLGIATGDPPPDVPEIVMEPPPPTVPPQLVHRVKNGRPVRAPDSPMADLSQTRKIQVFSAPHCPPCRAFEPVVRAFCASRPDLELQILDVTTPEGGTAATANDVSATPTSLFLDRHGHVVTRILGYRSTEELTGLLGSPSP